MQSDIDKIMNESPDSGNGAEFDYNNAFAGLGDEAAQREVGGTAVPAFGYYVVHFGGAKARFNKNGVPDVRPWCKVKQGLSGTEGTLVTDSIGSPFKGAPLIGISPTYKDEDGTVQKRTPKELADRAEVINKLLNRIAKVGKFVQARPSNLNSQESLDAYAAQFEANGGFDAIVEIAYEPARGGYGERNRIKWESIAALDDPAQTKQFAGKTALQEAEAKIAARLEAAAKGKPKGVAKATEALFN